MLCSDKHKDFRSRKEFVRQCGHARGEEGGSDPNVCFSWLTIV